MESINQFILGLNVMAAVVAALFFLRFWRKTRDRLFVIFSIAFLLLAANWLLVAVLRRSEEQVALFYVLRLLAFIAIIVGIVDKNRVRE
jgi:hypothetical protein